ncbi:MAG: YbaK/EbsC family protein [Acidimicrobiia bacterium]
MSGERVRKYLMEHGVQYQTHTHPTAYTANEIAEAEHVSGEQMAKVVMLMADDRLVMAVIPGNQMVDIEKAHKTLGARTVRLADEKEFAPMFVDCEVGAEPPFGPLYDVAMVVDNGLQRPRITFNAGSHTDTITIALDDYLGLTKPEKVDLALGI